MQPASGRGVQNLLSLYNIYIHTHTHIYIYISRQVSVGSALPQVYKTALAKQRHGREESAQSCATAKRKRQRTRRRRRGRRRRKPRRTSITHPTRGNQPKRTTYNRTAPRRGTRSKKWAGEMMTTKLRFAPNQPQPQTWGGTTSISRMLPTRRHPKHLHVRTGCRGNKDDP